MEEIIKFISNTVTENKKYYEIKKGSIEPFLILLRRLGSNQ